MVRSEVWAFALTLSEILGFQAQCFNKEVQHSMPEVSNLLVVGMGVGVVFFGLVCLILVCKLVGFIAKLGGPEPAPAKPAASAAVPAATAIPNRQELVAAISVAIAIEMGTEPSALRIVSLKKL